MRAALLVLRFAFPFGVVLLVLAAPAAAQTYRGALGSGDDQIESGEYVDWYEVEAQVGETLVIEMASTSNLDPYLMLLGPGGVQRDNDDVSEGDVRHSYIEHTVTGDGTFQVGATSYQPGETGSYTLTIQFAEAGYGYAPAEPAPGPYEITLDDLGPVIYGMPPREAEAAWGSPWVSTSTPDGVTAGSLDDPRLPFCYFVGPPSNEPFFIVASGVVVAGAVRTAAYPTSRGIRVGSTIDEVYAAYPGRIVEETSGYNGEPMLVFVPPDDDGSARMAFLTENGRVSMIKTGMIHAVLEDGCPR